MGFIIRYLIGNNAIRINLLDADTTDERIVGACECVYCVVFQSVLSLMAPVYVTLLKLNQTFIFR